MDAGSPAATGRIFISYRREDSAYPAGWLYDRLADRFGPQRLFKDIDSIAPGDDFVAKISAAVDSCNVLLALIGDEWLTIADADGRRRLDDPADFVRVEVEAALARDVRVIPVLVEGARMPLVEELPPSLAPLARRQAIELNPAHFAADLQRLLEVLEGTPAGATSVPKSDTVPVASPTTKADRRWPRAVYITAHIVGGLVTVMVLERIANLAGLAGFELLFVWAVTALAAWQAIRPGATSVAQTNRRRGISLTVIGGLWTLVEPSTLLPELAAGIGVWLLVRNRR